MGILNPVHPSILIILILITTLQSSWLELAGPFDYQQR